MCGDRDADAYRAFVTDWGARNEAVFAAFQDVPTAGRLGRHLWGAGKATDVGGLEMSRQFLQPADQLLDEHFADERLKTALAWLGAQSGPPGARGRDRRPGRLERADAPDAAGPRGRRLRRADRARWPSGCGGCGGTRAARRRRRRDHPVRRPGHRRHDRRPASTSPPARSSPAATCSPPSSCSATRRCWPGRPPRCGSATGSAWWCGWAPATCRAIRRRRGTSPYSAMQLLAPSRTHLRAAHGEFAAGRPPTEPAVLVMTFSAIDPTIAPAGKHNVTAWAQWHPYELSTGERWDDIAGARGRQDRGAGRAVAPGFAEQHRAGARADTARPRARAGPAPRQRDARRDGAGLDVRLPAAARAGGLPYAGARPVPHRRVDPPGRRGVRRVRPHRGAGRDGDSGGGGDDGHRRTPCAAARRRPVRCRRRPAPGCSRRCHRRAADRLPARRGAVAATA